MTSIIDVLRYLPSRDWVKEEVERLTHPHRAQQPLRIVMRLEHRGNTLVWLMHDADTADDMEWASLSLDLRVVSVTGLSTDDIVDALLVHTHTW